MKKWEIVSESRINPSTSLFRVSLQSEVRVKNQESRIDDVVDILLENRGIVTSAEREKFLHPKLTDVTVASVGIDKKQLDLAIKRIRQAIDEKEAVIVFGDYDVDGITGVAILWETLYALGANVLPYIPHRVDEGYGLSKKGIENVILNSFQDPKMLKQVQHDKIKLIITVDNGIVAHAAVTFANSLGIDVIITDHHVPSATPPDALAIVHTTKLCGAGVAWALAQELKTQNAKRKITDSKDEHLELVALATIADLVPLTGANRILTTVGLKALQKTKRLGLLELFKEAALDSATIGVYEVGHVIAPRLNAMGRLEFAMESLRLLCTKDKKRAEDLALKLGQTNRERQLLTKESAGHAVTRIKNQESTHSASHSTVSSDRIGSGQGIKSLLFVSDENYQQGVIGLVAGKLVETFYRPAIVVAIGETYSKASARSVSGFNIIEFIRSASAHLVDAGGHPMAAGFTVETAKLSVLQKTLEDLAETILTADMLTRTLRIDMELPLQSIDTSLYNELQALAPFGMGNPEPTFVSRNVQIVDMRLIGKDRNHVKFTVRSSQFTVAGIGFGMAEVVTDIHVGDSVDIVYTIDENVWNGNRSLQLKIKDIVLSR